MIFYLCYAEAFDTVPHTILIKKDILLVSEASYSIAEAFFIAGYGKLKWIVPLTIGVMY